MAMLSDNIFLKIISKEIPARVVYEDEHCLAFHDIGPKAPIHLLIIPKQVIPTHDAITEAHAPLIGHLHVVAAKLAAQLGLTEGYRLIINCNEHGGQTVPHLHIHLMGGRSFAWPPG